MKCHFCTQYCSNCFLYFSHHLLINSSRPGETLQRSISGLLGAVWSFPPALLEGKGGAHISCIWQWRG